MLKIAFSYTILVLFGDEIVIDEGGGGGLE